MTRYFIIILIFLMTIYSSSLANDETNKSFVKKRYTIQGSARIEDVNGQKKLTFSDDFRTKNGPDLKIYLSKHSIESLSSQDVDQSAISLSVLKSHKGPQSYVIPPDINLNDFQSVVIQCEAYTVLWGGFDL